MDNATTVVDEAINEAIGVSPGMWALVVVVVWLTCRARAASPAAVQADAPTG
jgi:hypothetical protein